MLPFSAEFGFRFEGRTQVTHVLDFTKLMTPSYLCNHVWLSHVIMSVQVSDIFLYIHVSCMLLVSPMAVSLIWPLLRLHHRNVQFRYIEPSTVCDHVTVCTVNFPKFSMYLLLFLSRISPLQFFIRNYAPEENSYGELRERYLFHGLF